MAELKGTLSTSSLEAQIDTSEKNIQDNLSQASSITSLELENNISQTGSISAVQSLIAKSIKNNKNITSELLNNPNGGFGYVYFLYSAVEPEKQEDITLLPNDDTAYLGVLSTNQPTRPEDYRLYTWIRIRGIDGEKGEQGDKGDKGDSGETTLTINNPLFFTGFLNVDKWEIDNLSRGSIYYYQEIDVTNKQLISSTLSEEELINYLNLKITDRTTPLVDLLVSNTNVDLGLEQIENWKYISRVCLIKDEYEENEEEVVKYYLRFECYKQAPKIQLPFQAKVI